MEQETGTKFSVVYNRFLESITDDMYMELTPQDTIKDLQKMLINSIPNFEFPRKCLTDYNIHTKVVSESEISDGDFVIGVVWNEEHESVPDETPQVLIECSCFNVELTPEEIHILALLMKCEWVQRQVSSIENTRMKYSGSDFKMTSQANHLSKLLSLLSEAQREAFHMQRLYKRRKLDKNGVYRSNWHILRTGSREPS